MVKSLYQMDIQRYLNLLMVYPSVFKKMLTKAAFIGSNIQ